MAKISRTAAVWREPAQLARLEEYHRLHPERKGKAPLVSFVQASGDRPGIGVDSEGNEFEFAEKPPDSDFITPKPGAPEGQSIEDPVTGEFIPLNTAQERRQSIYQSAGGIRDRKNERVMAAKLFARQESKKQIDGKTTEFGYTPKQQRNLDAIQNSRAKLEQEFSEKMWTPDQMHRMEVELSQREGLILPQRVRRQPTVQDQFNANIVTLPNGSKALFNPAKGTTEPLDVGTKIPYKDWTKGIADTTEAMTTFNDVTGKEIVPDPAEVQRVFMDNYRAYQEAQGIVGGAAGEPQQPDLLAERKAGFGRKVKPQPAAREVPAKPVDQRKKWKADLTALEQEHGGKPPREAMQQFGESFVADAVAGGMGVEEAVESFITFWKEERSKRGIGAVGSSRFVNKAQIKVAAQASRLEFLRAKAGQ